jgi:anaerobic selenocysteine-containing dehydrogenase
MRGETTPAAKPALGTQLEADMTAGLSRRGLLAGGALLGAWLPTHFGSPAEASTGENAILSSNRPDSRYDLALADHHILSSCLQCNTGCGIRAKIENGVVTKIDGNPYSPWTMLPHLSYRTAVDDAAPVDGSLCPKGQSGLQTAYDPYRLRKVLKRAGQRGENRWISIPFEQAIDEITAGGRLFADVPGEESREVDGLNTLLALRDPAVAEAMATDVKAIWDEPDPTTKAQLVAEFKRTHAAHLHTLIDPDHPDMGPRNNQVVLAWGRLKDGRGDLYKRFAEAFGTVNAHGHTTVCQGSLYFTCKAISEQYIGGKFTDGKKFYWQADTENSEFILFVGANLFEANYGPPNRTVRLTTNLVEGKTRIAVADPRFSKLASKAWRWLPVKPGSDGALAMGFIRWMLEEGRFDSDFLSCANPAAAHARGESSWTNASLLVEITDGKAGPLVRAADVDIDGAPLKPAETRPYTDPATGEDKEYEEKFFLALVDGVPTAVDINDEATPVFADLLVDTTLPDGTVVKSGLQLLLDEARQRTVAEWAELAGITEDQVVEIARELTSHGKAAAVDIHRGVAQHTNGFYNVLGWMTVNMLLGNYDAKGGMIAASTYDTKGKGKGELFDVTSLAGKMPSFGMSSIRHGLDYEKTTLFDGYPAKRNWYPLSSDIYEEIIPSIADEYPYPIKALFLYMGAPTYALPAGHTTVEILADVDRLPLFVASDIIIGSTSMYADYIFPDLSYLERWEFQGSHPNIANKVQPVRQPVIAPIPEECEVFGQTYPISLETMLLGLAEQLDLPGFGQDAFGTGRHLTHPDELYLRQVANLAFGETPDGSQAVPDADDRELELFLNSRTHLPASVFDPARWEATVGPDLWRKVVYVLNRGGRFEDHADGYDGDRVAHPYGKLLNLYQEKTAKTTHAGTGHKYPGLATYVPIQDYTGAEPDAYRDGYDLALITHRVISQTKSRTIADPWLSALLPENGILINPADLDRLGLRDGQQVQVLSATNQSGEWNIGPDQPHPMIGKLVSTQTLRPGVVSFALGFGHWATGANDVTIDGTTVKGERRRRAGIHANAAMWTDPVIKNTCMFDPIGGSVSFYDSHVRLEPA